jgi:hypothetical protein
MILYMFYLMFEIVMIALYTLFNFMTNKKFPKVIERQIKATRTVFWDGFLVLFLQGYIGFAISMIMEFQKPSQKSFGID